MRDIDQITRQIRAVCSDVIVEQLPVVHPGADDDGLWFFSQPGSPFEVQLESPNGMCPFQIETLENKSRFKAQSVSEAVDILKQLLHLSSSSA